MHLGTPLQPVTSPKTPTFIMPDGVALAKKAIAARDATIPKEYALPESLFPLPKDRRDLLQRSGLLDKKELEIVNQGVIPLAKAIADKKYTSVEVTKAFIKAAAIAQQVRSHLHLHLHFLSC